jgi:hypothetical protein
MSEALATEKNTITGGKNDQVQCTATNSDAASKNSSVLLSRAYEEQSFGHDVNVLDTSTIEQCNANL